MDDRVVRPGRGNLCCEVVAREPDGCLLRVTGEVDIATAPRLAGFLSAELAGTAPGTRVRLDLGRVGFFSAAGVRAVVAALDQARCRDVELVLAPVSSSAALVLALCDVGGAAEPDGGTVDR
jgi:anti-anti-sigma factor